MGTALTPKNIDALGLHNSFLSWIEDIIGLCTPEDVYLCDGSASEYSDLCNLLVDSGTFIPHSPSRPNSFICRSDPADVARVEKQTFIASQSEADAGPTNNWADPVEMKVKLKRLFSGSMAGRRMYIIPFRMGPTGSSFSRCGIEITDSPYVACNMHIMSRVSPDALPSDSSDFVKCLHSVGSPLSSSDIDVPWPCNIENRAIVHFPEERSIWSFGSGYGGNALLGKKCFALRIGSVIAREEGWLAEHMLVASVTNPENEKYYIAAAFPSGCGKTNMAMLQSSLPGWEVRCLGDDIAWLRFGNDGRLYAVNPEYGFFGVAPGTSMTTNANAMASFSENAIFTNVAATDKGEAWWEGISEDIPEGIIDWRSRKWDSYSSEPASHPNARFTAPLKQCPSLDAEWDNPNGVPISAIIFGGRRPDTVPLVYEALSWNHGVFIGASMSSQKTAAAEGSSGDLRHDPFAMLPFCGYNMGEYFGHWISMGSTRPELLPRIFHVNWFRKSSEGSFLWPGFGENIRIIKWICDRLGGRCAAKKSAIGLIPRIEDIDLSGLNISSSVLDNLFAIEPGEWGLEIERLHNYFTGFGKKMPSEIFEELLLLKNRLGEQ